jgi:hypothetical protein
MFWKFLLQRLQEPSTWAGIGHTVAACVVPGIPVAGQIALAVTGALAIVNGESSADTPAQ